MTENTLVGIALVIAFIVARLNYVRQVKGGKTKKQKFVDKAKAQGSVTTGSYTDARYNFGNRGNPDADLKNGSVVVKYVYSVKGKNYYKVMQFRNNGVNVKDYPIAITVYYDAKNPKKSVCSEEISTVQNIRSGCLSTILAFVITIFCVFHILRFIFL